MFVTRTRLTNTSANPAMSSGPTDSDRTIAPQVIPKAGTMNVTVLATVVSKHRDPSGQERLFLDAGKKILTSDVGYGTDGFGRILYNARTMLPLPHAHVTALSEEHGWVDVTGGATLDVGDRTLVAVKPPTFDAPPHPGVRPMLTSGCANVAAVELYENHYVNIYGHGNRLMFKVLFESRADATAFIDLLWALRDRRSLRDPRGGY